MKSNHTSIASVIDSVPIGAFRMRIFAISFLIVLMDGFDTQAVGFAAKAMSASLNIPIASFGEIFSAGLFGAMVGALTLGPLSDRYGRRWTLIGSILTFAVFSLLTPQAAQLNGLLLCRFLAGLGLGGAIPNLLALSSEYAPRRMRGMLTGVLYAAFPLGGAVGAATSAHLIPLYGWRVLFHVGGTVPLFLAALVMALPESLPFLLRRGANERMVHTIIERISRDCAKRDTTYVDLEERVAGLPIRYLFSQGRATATLLLWISFFMCFVLLIVLVLWTPALLHGAGVGEHAAALIVGLVNLGSVAGTGLGGRLLDRFVPARVLPGLFLCGALSVSPLGHVTGLPILLALCATLSGFFIGAGSAGLLSLAVSTYPSAMRATGLGWAMALGRLGQVAGPLAVGAVLAAGFSINRIFLFSAVPALCAAAAVVLLEQYGTDHRIAGVKAQTSRTRNASNL